MIRAATTIQLSKHPRGWRKAMGLTAIGTTKTFYFDDDLKTAQRQARAVAGVYDRLQAAGGNVWTDDAFADADRAKREATEAGEPVAAGEIVGGGATLHQAIDAFSEKLASEAGRRDATRAGLPKRLQVLKRCLPECPLASIDYDALDRMAEALLARPTSKVTGKPMAVTTIKALFQLLVQLLLWADASPSYKWELPRGAERLFVAKRAAMSRIKGDDDDDTGEDDGDRHYSLDQLKAIWFDLVSLPSKLYFLFALNCSFSQFDIATLKMRHLNLGPKPFIRRKRQKTRGKLRQVFVWRLWPETAELLKRHIAAEGERTKEKDALLFLTANANPLVWFSPSGARVDAITLRFEDTLTRALINDGRVRHSFGDLRKTGSQMIRDIAGREISEAMLGHTDASTGRFYNVVNFKKLGKALRIMRRQLEPIFAERNIDANTSTSPSVRRAKEIIAERRTKRAAK